jgi:Haem-degrading
MNFGYRFLMALAGTVLGASMSPAETLQTHRIPAALAVEAANEAISVCAKQGYRETADVVDADGATIAAIRGDGAGVHTRVHKRFLQERHACLGGSRKGRGFDRTTRQTAAHHVHRRWSGN